MQKTYENKEPKLIGDKQKKTVAVVRRYASATYMTLASELMTLKRH